MSLPIVSIAYIIADDALMVINPILSIPLEFDVTLFINTLIQYKMFTGKVQYKQVIRFNNSTIMHVNNSTIIHAKQ